MSQAPIALAAAQTVPFCGDVDANVERHIYLSQAAAAEGAQVVVFPELSLTGYDPDLADALALDEADQRLEPLREVAAETNATLVVGAPLRLGDDLHIAAFLLHPDRRVEVYTKIYLHDTECDVFRPNTRNPLLMVGDDVGAIAICADTNDIRHPARAAALGANLYLAGVCVTPDAYIKDLALVAGYARHYGFAVAMANFGGASGRFDAEGGSCALDPEGQVLASLERGEGVVVARREAGRWTATAHPVSAD